MSLFKSEILCLGVVMVLLVGGPKPSADSFTPGNLLVSTNEVLYEYTTAGDFVQSFAIPDASGENEDARDVSIDINGAAHVYNGTFEPYLSSLEPIGGTWDHRTFLGWSTANNGTYGGVDVFGRYVFVTDMETFGEGDEPQGVVRFDLDAGGAVRFAEDIEPIDLDVGGDGLVYALYPGGSPEGRMIDVYHPVTLAFVRTISLSDIFGHTGHRSIGVNAEGEVFVADWDGELQKVSAAGELIDVINLNDHGMGSLYDVDVASNGMIAVGDRFGGVAITDQDLSSVSTFTVGSGGIFVHLVPANCPADLDGSGAVDFGDILAILSAWGPCGAASPATEMLTLEPLDAQAVTDDGIQWTIDPDSIALNASRFAGIPLERRGVLEYSLADVPEDSVISSAQIEFDIATFTHPPDPVIEFHGYGGDGVLEVSDATVGFNLIGESPPIESLTTYAADLDPSFIESLLGGSSHLGLMTYQQIEGLQAAFWSDESGTPATVTIEFEHLECLEDLDGSGAVDFGDVLVVLSNWGECE